MTLILAAPMGTDAASPTFAHFRPVPEPKMAPASGLK
jgi:hypothetical protein